MILLNGPNTPFGRMALVTALELGITVENRVIAVGSAAFLDSINPLRQIPTLLRDEGDALYDSRVICGYFASLTPQSGLIPPDIEVAVRWALVVGLMEAGVTRQMERIRPQAQQSPEVIAGCERRIANAIARLETEADAVCADFARIDRLATAVALEYIDFRYPHAWRADAPRLAGWLAAVTDRPSMATTRPRASM